MKKTTYIIPRCDEYTMIEVNYIKKWNRLFESVLWKKIENFTTQTRSNTLKTLLEQSVWKYWYVLLKDKIIIQVVDYENNNRMKELGAKDFLNILFYDDNDKKDYIKSRFNWIFDSFIEWIKNLKWVEIIED